MLKKSLIAIIVFMLIVPVHGFGQQAAPSGSAAGASSAAAPIGQVSQPAAAPQAMPGVSGQYGQGQPITPQQAEMFQRLSPAQQQAIQAEMGKTGGALTPQAIESLKGRPEFRTMAPQDIQRAMERREGDRKEADIKDGTLQDRKPMLDKVGVEKSLFERIRSVGGYQEISLDLKPFGYDFFEGGPLKAATERRDVPVPVSYVVGPGDEVRILIWGRVNANYNLIVEKDGTIKIPQVGPVMVAGMTFGEMSKHLIKQAEQIVGANIDISMGALKSIPIFVLGDVKKPGSYTVGSFSTIMDALLAAGGPSGIGSMRNIQLKRNGRVVSTFDVYDLLIKGDKSKDVMVQGGDVVFVPVVGPLVGIAGNVKRPAIYELKGARDLGTLFDLAGGIVPTAYTQHIQVERIISNERQVVVDIDDKRLSRVKAFHLQDVDLVKVFNIVDREVNVVTLSGNVKRPGKYEYKRGMKLKDILKDEKDLLPETFLDYGIIKRMEPPDFRQKVVGFNVRELFSGTLRHNIDLKPQDSIVVFSKWVFKDKPFVVVEGEVRGIVEEQGAAHLETGRKEKMTGDARVIERLYGEKREEAGQQRPKEATGSMMIEKRTLDRLRNLGVTRLDDPRFIELRNSGLIDQKEIDQLIRMGITRLDDPRLAETKVHRGEEKELGEKRRASIRIPLVDNMGVRDAILAAGGLTQDAYPNAAELYRTNDADKSISVVKFNLERAMSGHADDNITLKSNDRIVVQSIRGYVYKKVVAVDGDVRVPGEYEFAENMTVRDLIFAAGNILESAYLDEAEITSQYVESGRQVKLDYRKINLKNALRGEPADNVNLKPYDLVTVKRLQDWRKVRYVTVDGEVKYPGRFVATKNERLSSVIARAGGYTNEAYLRGAVFTRKKVKEMQQKSLNEMIERLEKDLLIASSTTTTNLTTAEVEHQKAELMQRRSFLDVLRKVEPTGRMTVYIAHLRLLKGSQYDVELEDEDVLFIPRKNQVVNVVGAVMSNGTFVYNERMKPEDYIKMAGGYSRSADESNTFIMKVDGTARRLSSRFVDWNPYKGRWEAEGFKEEIGPIEAGDSIVVPERLVRTDWMRTLRDVATVLGGFGTTAATVAVLWKTMKNN